VAKIVVGSEQLASGRVTRHQLRTHYRKVHHNVYAPIGAELTALDRAHAAWLWSRRQAVLVGNSAAAMLGTKWLRTVRGPRNSMHHTRSNGLRHRSANSEG
jgi:hypothetical protein